MTHDIPRGREWVLDGLCFDDPVWFDHPDEARRLCAQCPVIAECDQYAREVIEREGRSAWGGKTVGRDIIIAGRSGEEWAATIKRERDPRRNHHVAV